MGSLGNEKRENLCSNFLDIDRISIILGDEQPLGGDQQVFDPDYSSIQPIEDFVEKTNDGRHSHNLRPSNSGSQKALIFPLINTSSPKVGEF